jgi:hypothetical protein
VHTAASIIFAPVGYGRLVKRIDRGTIGRSESLMKTVLGNTDRLVLQFQRKFILIIHHAVADEILALAHASVTGRAQGGIVKFTGALQIVGGDGAGASL